jgi:hypothetical protein
MRPAQPERLDLHLELMIIPRDIVFCMYVCRLLHIGRIAHRVHGWPRPRGDNLFYKEPILLRSSLPRHTFVCMYMYGLYISAVFFVAQSGLFTHEVHKEPILN